MCCAQLLSHVQLFLTPQTAAHQAPSSPEILQARILEWVAMPFSRGSSQPRDRPMSPALQSDSLLSHQGSHQRTSSLSLEKKKKIHGAERRKNSNRTHFRQKQRFLLKIANHYSQSHQLIFTLFHSLQSVFGLHKISLYINREVGKHFVLMMIMLNQTG